MWELRKIFVLALTAVFVCFGVSCSSSPNGGGGGSTGGAGGTGGSTKECANSLGCATRSDGKTVCSSSVGVCVQCLKASDCAGVDGGTQDCIDNACVSFANCVNSLGCPKGRVCDRDTSRCVECTASADCGGEAGTQRCVANTCRMACASDNNCTPYGLLCNTSGGYCVSCVSDVDCPESRWCNMGTCTLDICVPGATRCDPTGLSTCNTAGSTWSSPVTCGTGRICSASQGSAACLTQICTPSSLFCATGSEQVLSCASDGLSSSLSQDCSTSGQVCVSGSCKPVACTAGARYCASSVIRTCSTKGDSSTVYQTCTSSQYCDSTASTPACKTRVCTAGAAACNGSIATTCNPDGSGYVPGGTDCSAAGLYCVAGVCTAHVCAPSTYYCQSGAVRHCSSDGMTSTLYSTCASTQYCDSAATTPSCKTRICTADAPVCNGTIATTCNTDGSDYVSGGTDCSASSLYCSAGTCKARVCSPSTYFCDANTVRSCASDGLSSTLSSTCSSTQYCDSTATTPSCKAQVCTPDTPACNGTIATTCNANGSGYISGGTDCSTSSLYCSAGACKARVCSRNTYFCDANTVRSCASDGTSSTLSSTCSSTQYCDSTATTASCTAQVCTPDAPACNGTIATTCNDNGSGYVSGGTDCSASGIGCSAGVCATVEAVPADLSITFRYENYIANYAKLNVYKVTALRTLTVIEQYLTVSAGSALTWVVLESATLTGTYTSVRVASSTVNSATVGYVSSGTLVTPITLKANYYYAIGVYWTSISSGVYHHELIVTPPLTTSFGSLVSGISYYSSSLPTSIDISGTNTTTYPQRLTLTAG